MKEDEVRRGEVRRGRIVPRAMVPNGAGTAKGWRVPAIPPRIPTSHPICFCFPYTIHPRALKEERELERKRRKRGGGGEREKRRRRDGLSIFIMFALKKERYGGKRGGRETGRKKWKRNERRWEIHAWKARAARKNLQPRARV